jgi:hypothetical protein
VKEHDCNCIEVKKDVIKAKLLSSPADYNLFPPGYKTKNIKEDSCKCISKKTSELTNYPSSCGGLLVDPSTNPALDCSCLDQSKFKSTTNPDGIEFKTATKKHELKHYGLDGKCSLGNKVADLKCPCLVPDDNKKLTTPSSFTNTNL